MKIISKRFVRNQINGNGAWNNAVHIFSEYLSSKGKDSRSKGK